jgi:hypothetical protein
VDFLHGFDFGVASFHKRCFNDVLPCPGRMGSGGFYGSGIDNWRSVLSFFHYVSGLTKNPSAPIWFCNVNLIIS